MPGCPAPAALAMSAAVVSIPRSGDGRPCRRRPSIQPRPPGRRCEQGGHRDDPNPGSVLNRRHGRCLPGLSGRGAGAGLVLAWLLLAATPARAALEAETAFVLSSFSFLFWGVLVIWMWSGFAMVEAGSVGVRHATVVCLKNLGTCSIACLCFYLVGYNLMRVGVEPGGWVGSLAWLYRESAAEQALLAAPGPGAAVPAAVLARGHAVMSDWLFQMAFLVSAASIISGTLAERVRLAPYFVYIALLTTLLYPVVGAWSWGGGWLASLGFRDYAGATNVHSVGGWAALAGAIVVGARRGKFRADGSVRETPPNNVPMATLGVLIIWFGFLGFNGGSRLSLASAVDAVAVADVIANSVLASMAGLLAAVLTVRRVFGRLDLRGAMNGGLAGLAAIAASPEVFAAGWPLFVGGVGGILSVFGTWLLERLRVDDEVGAIPVHLCGGVWGTLSAGFTPAANFWVQLTGAGAVAAFVFGLSLAYWLLVDRLVGARISREVEELGQDAGELGVTSFPEFLVSRDDRDSGKDSGPNS